MTDLSDKEEQELNPSPRPYKVSFRAKLFFVGFSFIGLGVYGSMLVDRRRTEQRFLSHQELAPVKLMPLPMPPLRVYDPKTKAEVNVNFNDGSYILLNVWATWCPPCQKEMPSLAKLSEQFKGKLRVVALSIDDDVTAVSQFIDTHKLALTIWWDKDKLSIKQLGVEKYPETFLISPDGYLTTQFSGPRDWVSPQVVDYFLNVLK